MNKIIIDKDDYYLIEEIIVPYGSSPKYCIKDVIEEFYNNDISNIKKFILHERDIEISCYNEYKDTFWLLSTDFILKEFFTQVKYHKRLKVINEIL